MTDFRYDKDAQGIVVVTMDMQGQNANTMNARFEPGMRAICDRLDAERGLTGVVFASAKPTFFAGGDLHDILATETADAAVFARIEASKAVYRRLEKLPVPVVAAVGGAALGGGYELCLACNHRVIVDDPRAVVGLPEVTLGLLPGAGGVVRLTAKLGLEKALPYLLEGRQVPPRAALEAGLVDQIVPDRDALIPAAKAWIAAHPDAHAQPWDIRGFRYPGGGAQDPRVRQTMVAAPAMLYRKTRGLMPAPERILDVAVTSMKMDFDAALRMETRRFIGLMASKEAKAAITTFFFGMQAVKGGKLRPGGADGPQGSAAPRWQARNCAVLGAGAAGAEIAHAHAACGLPVWLQDSDKARAEAARAEAGARCDGAARTALLERITAADGDAEPGSRDLVIAALPEEPERQRRVIAATWPMLAPDGIYASTSAAPAMAALAEACPDPARFVGLHFCPPAHRAAVVEIIGGRETGADTLRRAYDHVQRLGCLPILVDGRRGAFSARVVGSYLDEGCQLLADGAAPVAVERAAWLIGMPMGPLQGCDEHPLIQNRKLRLGDGAQTAAAAAIADAMIAQGRGGPQRGGGFYDQDGAGTRRLWHGLGQFARRDAHVTLEEMRDRLLYRQAIETLRCFDEAVLRSEIEANLGGIHAAGFPPHTGGPLQFIRGLGLDAFAARAAELADRFGERFAVAPAALERLRAADPRGMHAA